MTYVLGRKSRSELEGVKPNLVKVVRRALEYTEVDFAVHDGIRAISEQVEFVKAGASQTLVSLHIRQQDGFGHAVDLVPFIAGRKRWEMSPCCKIAHAVRQAANELDVNIRWGGCWSLLNGSEVWDTEYMVGQYVTRKLLADRDFFLDGPHYELLDGG